jgi:histidinol-phosphate aminotransferase
LGAPVKAVPLTAELRLDLDLMVSQSTGAGVFYICNPNNPTATAVPAAAVTAAIESVISTSPDTYVLVDEAYFEYADLPGFGTAVPLVATYPQVIVARTFSKIHGMAGMRVGYAIAQPATLERLRAHHSPSGMSVMSRAAAASLEDTAHLARQIALNREVRATTVGAFTAKGFRVAPSDANFLFVDIGRDARAFQDACRQENVMVGRAFPPLLTWARISIGTKDEMEKAIPVFMKVLSQPATQTAALNLDALDNLPSELTERGPTADRMQGLATSCSAFLPRSAGASRLDGLET